MHNTMKDTRLLLQKGDDEPVGYVTLSEIEEVTGWSPNYMSVAKKRGTWGVGKPYKRDGYTLKIIRYRPKVF